MDAYAVNWNEATTTQTVCSHIYVKLQTWYKYIQCMDIHSSIIARHVWMLWINYMVYAVIRCFFFLFLFGIFFFRHILVFWTYAANALSWEVYPNRTTFLTELYLFIYFYFFFFFFIKHDFIWSEVISHRCTSRLHSEPLYYKWQALNTMNNHMVMAVSSQKWLMHFSSGLQEESNHKVTLF